jgi:hypothetical protein
MRFVFLETPLFTRLLPEYLDDESYMALQQVFMTRTRPTTSRWNNVDY